MSSEVSRQALRTRLEAPWCVLDTETTGLGPRDEVLEVAIVDESGAVLVHSLVQPRTRCTSEAQAVHGITPEDLKRAPTWTDVWPLVREHLVARTVFGFHAAFDLRLVRQTCARWNRPFLVRDIECVRAWSRRILGPHVHSLNRVARELDLPSPRHRAADDAELARRVLLRLVDDSVD